MASNHSNYSKIGVSELANILKKDPRLLEIWSEFCDKFAPDATSKKQWENQIKDGQYYKVFVGILSDWICRTRERKLSELIEILGELECGLLKGKLEKIGQDCMIAFESCKVFPSKSGKGRTEQASAFPSTSSGTESANNLINPIQVFASTTIEEKFYKPSLDQSHVPIPPDKPKNLIQESNIQQDEPNQETNQKNSIKNLPIRAHAFAGIHTKCLSFGILKPCRYFTGRSEELDQLHSIYESNRQNLLIICGLGGSGKSELCRKFLHQMNNKNISRIWLHGDKIETMEHSVSSLAFKLNLKREKQGLVEYFKYLLDNVWLDLDNNGSKLILVIDNMELDSSEATHIMEILKAREHIFTIVTIRDSKKFKKGMMKLPPLDDEQVKIILNNSVDTLTELEEMHLICVRLRLNYPLELQQGAAFFKGHSNPDYNLSKYKEEFQRIDALDPKRYEYPISALTTSKLILQKLKNHSLLCNKILQVLAYLEQDGIECDLLKEICEEMKLTDSKDDTKFKKALESIRSYSMAKKNKSILSVHLLTQQQMRQNEEKYSKELLQAVLNIWAKKEFNGIDVSGVQEHVSMISSHSYRLDFYSFLPHNLHLDLEYFVNEKGLVCHIKNKLAKKLSKQGRHKESNDLCEQILNSEYDNEYEAAYRTYIPNKNREKPEEILDKYLQKKMRDSEDENSNTITLKLLLAETLEKAKEERGEELFCQVREYYKKNESLLEEKESLIVKRNQVRICDWEKMTRAEMCGKYARFNFLGILKTQDFERILKHIRKNSLPMIL